MAINKVMVGESLVNDNDPTGTMAEIAHIDLLIGPRGSAVETAFCNGLCNNKDGFTSLLAVVGPNLVCKPNTMMFNKVTIKGAKQAVQMFGPAQKAVAMAVADSVEAGVIPKGEADDLYSVLEYSSIGKLIATKLYTKITIKLQKALLKQQSMVSHQ